MNSIQVSHRKGKDSQIHEKLSNINENTGNKEKQNFNKETDFEGKKNQTIKTLRNKKEMNEINNSGKHCQ